MYDFPVRYFLLCDVEHFQDELPCNVSDVTTIDWYSCELIIVLLNHTMPIKSSTHTSSRKQPSKSKSKKKRSIPIPSYESVQKTVKDSKKKHGKSKNTTDNYDGNVRRGKEFIAAFVMETLEGTEEIHGDGFNSKTDGEGSMDPNLHQAFAGPPIECTPTALAMFIAQKCFTEECGKSTASAIHAAFLRYYDIM
jgi:hypothetical protein